MRLWSLHPQYLDTKGLVALWREALLAQAVLRGRTRGYRNHPQLVRFKNQNTPVVAIALYLQPVYAEAVARGYAFDQSKIGPVGHHAELAVTTGQLEYEWGHLLAKLRDRSPTLYARLQHAGTPQAHPLFRIQAGAVEAWERR